MLGPSLLRIGIGVAIYMALLGLLRYRPWQAASAAPAPRQRLTVGFLPVT